jgi:hypothetical protein
LFSASHALQISYYGSFKKIIIALTGLPYQDYMLTVILKLIDVAAANDNDNDESKTDI